MRAIKPNTRRRSLWRAVMLAIGAIVIGGTGTVGGLAAFKVIDPATLAFWRGKEAIPADWVGVPFCVRSIPAYTRITRDYVMLDLKSEKWALKWYPPDRVPKAAITKLKDILGRVTAREKPAAYAFVESDFLPPGSSPGIAGGTPEGKRAITLDAGKLKGVFELQEGDHVDLLASVAVDMPGTGHSNSGRLGNNVVATPDVALLGKRSFVRPLVQDGVVVTPAKTRNVPTTSASLTQGTSTRTMPVQEIVLAVAPEEVAPLAEAMDLKYEITCVARSGRPAAAASSELRPSAGAASQGAMSQVLATLGKAFLDKESAAATNKAPPPPGRASAVNRTKSEAPANDRMATDITPGLDPLAQTRFLEVMIGKERQFVLFTGPGNSPVVQPSDDGSIKAAPGGVPAGVAAEGKQ